MGGSGKVSSGLEIIKNLKEQVKRDKKDCQSEVIDLFKRIFNAIDTHMDTPSVNKGLDDLAADDVFGLEARLSTITKERDNLLDTVQNLRAELKQMSFEMKLKSIREPIPLVRMPDDTVKHDQDIQIQEVKSLDIAVKRPRIRKRGAKQKKQEEHNEASLNDSNNSDECDIYEVEGSDAKGIDYVLMGREVSPAKDLVQKLIREGHDDVKQNDSHGCESDATQKSDPDFPSTPNTRFKCDQCPWSTPQKHRMKAHIEEVHEMKKRYQCEKCDYATARKDRLERHWDSVHNDGRKKFKCGRCPYSSAEKAKLQRHMNRGHE